MLVRLAQPKRVCKNINHRTTEKEIERQEV